MDIRIVLTKILTLIYRSRLVDNLENDDLIRTVLTTVKTDSPEFNFGSTNIPKKLKEFCVELLEDKEAIAKEVLLPRLSLMLEKDPKLGSTLKEAIEVDYDESSNKRVVTSLIKNLYNYYRESQATELLAKISYDLKFNRSKIPNFNEYLRDTIAKLEPLSMGVTTIKDPAIVNEVDFEKADNLDVVFDQVKSANNNTGTYKLGWQAMNRMFKISRGVFVGVAALENKYKSNMTNSMFVSLATENAPIITKKESDEGKKPLLLRISFEDALHNNLQFMYQYLKSTDGDFVSPKEMIDLDSKEMGKYVHQRLTATGFHIKMIRVDPSQWSYAHVANKIIELEAQGYSVHVLVLDYITLLPTTGCTQGATGADKRDLVRRMRNFCSARDIVCISPLQLGPEARQMLRNGVPEHQLVKECLNKSPLDSSKAINQELDVLIYIHLFKHKKRTYLAVALDRDRAPTVSEDEDRFFMLQFKNNSTPIAGDLHTHDTSFKVLPKGDATGTAGSLLDEMLS